MKTDRRIYKVLIQLKWIIQRDIIQRDIVRHIFKTGWEIFRRMHQGELLIPFGRALAWSYVLNNRKTDVVCLLQLIQEGKPPFGWSTRMLSQPPIQPIRELLEQLVSEESGVDRKHTSPDFDQSLVEIKSKPRKIALCLNDTERSIVLKKRVLFREDLIVIRKSTSYQPTVYPQHSFPYGIFRHGSIRNETINRDIMKALAHQRAGP